MSKLVAGAAASKLLIVRRPVEAQKDGLKAVKEFIQDIGKRCSGNLFLAFVPYYALNHPHLKLHGQVGPLPMELYGRAASDESLKQVPLEWLP